MKRCFKKVLLGMLLCLLPSSYAAHNGSNEDNGSLEWFVLKNVGNGDVNVASQNLNLLLKAIEEDNAEAFLDAFKNFYPLSIVTREKVWERPLHREKGILKLENFTGERSFNLLQIAIKKQAFNVVHALLLQSVEIDVNKMNIQQNPPITDLALEKDPIDLLMLAVKNMKNEEGLKILAALIAAGVTCDNRTYDSRTETPLTFLIKQNRFLSEKLITQGAILLINAGFDPYEAKNKGDGAPLIRAVIKGYKPVIAASVQCFGEKYEKDPSFVNDEKLREQFTIVGEACTLPNSGLYESIKETASSTLEKAETILQDIRKDLLKHRNKFMQKLLTVNSGKVELLNFYANIVYQNLLPRWKKGPLKESIKALETLKQQVEQMNPKFISQKYNDNVVQDKNGLITSLDSEITRRKLWEGFSVFDSSLEKTSVNHALNAERAYLFTLGSIPGAIDTYAHNFKLDPTYLEEMDKNKNRGASLKTQVQDLEKQVQRYLEEEAPKVVPTSSTSSSTTSSSSSATSTTSASIQIPPNTSSSLQQSTTSTHVPPLGSSPGLPPQQGRLPKKAHVEGDKETIEGTFNNMSLLQKSGLGLLAISLIGGMVYAINKLRSRRDKKPENRSNNVVEHERTYTAESSYV